ncbi:MAG: cysteine desulfurase, partial [Candidatus Kapabacteria bacterium]|nr:cysteine desulfurase [Candidatus Kapabacteria bacterium]
MIYLDNSATTRIDDDVLDAMLPWLRNGYGNASSTYGLGRSARVAIEDAREEIASLMNAHPAELIFTSGGTESNNTILKSCVGESAVARRIYYGATEHHAVIHPAEELRASGIETAAIAVGTDGLIPTEHAAALNSPATLVSIMHANNETGVVQDIAALRGAMPDVLLHTDAVQSFGKIPFDVQRLHVDFATLSAHKIHGPKGIGAMFIRKGIDFKAHQQGGGQERNRRAGTEATALIAGFQAAARNAIRRMEERAAHTRRLCGVLRAELQQRIPMIRINTPDSDALSLPTILNVSFTDATALDGESILLMMDMNGVCCSNGSACVSGTMQPSHVLSAMGRSDAEAKAAVRFSLS